MTDIAFLDKLATQITTLIQTDEKECFSGALLNQLTAAAVSLRMDLSEIMLDTPSEKTAPRILFEDIGLDEATKDFATDWGGDMTSLMIRPPLLITLENAQTWRSRPELAAVISRLGGTQLILSGRDSKVVRNGRNYKLALLRPDYPEWFVYAKGPHALENSQRLSLLETFQESIPELMPPESRLDEDEVDHLYFLFIREVLPGFVQAAQEHEGVKKAFTNWIGLYGMCGIELKPENFQRLPTFYKEWALLFVESIHSQKFIPILRQQMLEDA